MSKFIYKNKNCIKISKYPELFPLSVMFSNLVRQRELVVSFHASDLNVLVTNLPFIHRDLRICPLYYIVLTLTGN